jgi:hypothetical protein
LANRLSDAPDSESKLKIARQEGFEFDLEEAQQAKEDLGDDDALEKIVGGVCPTEVLHEYAPPVFCYYVLPT